MLNNPFGEEIFHSIHLKPPLVQLEAVLPVLSLVAGEMEVAIKFLQDMKDLAVIKSPQAYMYMCDKGNRQPSFITHHIEHSLGLYDIYNVKEIIPTKMCSLK